MSYSGAVCRFRFAFDSALVFLAAGATSFAGCGDSAKTATPVRCCECDFKGPSCSAHATSTNHNETTCQGFCASEEGRAACPLVSATIAECKAPGVDGAAPTFDCRDPGAACADPFLCAALPTDPQSYVCRDPRPPPICKSAPANQVVPFSEAAPGLVVHWTLDSNCISVSYEASLADLRDRLATAMGAWSDIPCSELCFAGPIEQAAAPDVDRRERRIHLRAASDGGIVGVWLTYNMTNGRAIAARIEVPADKSVRDELTLDDFLQFLGQAVGLTRPDIPAESVLDLTYSPGLNVYDAPTAADVDAFCRLYGNPALCGE